MQVGESNGEAALSCWPSATFSAERACRAVLQYMQDEGLTESQLGRLRGAAFVPVGNATRLMAPSQLFARMPVDFAPWMNEASREGFKASMQTLLMCRNVWAFSWLNLSLFCWICHLPYRCRPSWCTIYLCSNSWEREMLPQRRTFWVCCMGCRAACSPRWRSGEHVCMHACCTGSSRLCERRRVIWHDRSPEKYSSFHEHYCMCICALALLTILALCRSIARLLEYLLDDSASPLIPEVRGALSGDRIPVPTVQGSLLPSSSCVYSPLTAGLGPLGRLDGQAVVLVHPAVPMRVCTAMGIPALADVVEERLDASVVLQPVAMIQGIAAIDVAARMRDERFADAAHALLSLARQGGGGAAAALVTAEDVATALRAAADRLQFVEECRTSLVFQRGPRAIPLEASSKKVGRWGRGVGLGAYRRALHTYPYMPCISTTGFFTILHSSIQAPPHTHTLAHTDLLQVPIFVDTKTGSIIISSIPPAVPLSAALSAAISRLLSSGSILPLGPLLDCLPPQIDDVAAVLMGRSRGEAVGMDGAAPAASALLQATTAGHLGTNLAAQDAAAVQIRPMRSYIAGENGGAGV
jgi:hypothetical protein